MTLAVTVPRETKEFLPLEVLANEAAPSSFETAVVRWPARPSGWQPAVEVEGKPGVLIDGLTPGTWTVWVRLATALEEPVVYAGQVLVL